MEKYSRTHIPFIWARISFNRMPFELTQKYFTVMRGNSRYYVTRVTFQTIKSMNKICVTNEEYVSTFHIHKIIFCILQTAESIFNVTIFSLLCTSYFLWYIVVSNMRDSNNLLVGKARDASELYLFKNLSSQLKN